MNDIRTQISALRDAADPAAAGAIARLIDHGADPELNRINVLEFSKKHGLDEERTISAFLHASRLGLFDLTQQPQIPPVCLQPGSPCNPSD